MASSSATAAGDLTRDAFPAWYLATAVWHTRAVHASVSAALSRRCRRPLEVARNLEQPYRSPSEVHGEQMHCFFGLLCQDTIQTMYDRARSMPSSVGASRTIANGNTTLLPASYK